MGPLSGMKVIELTHIMAGPICGMMLADMGADVIKVEKNPHGDDLRRFAPTLPCGESASFMIVNRNKRAISLNLKQAGARQVLRRLLEGADAVMENYRAGTMERLGFGYEALRELNPGLIYCAISGFGRTGPMAAHGGFDLVAQGMSGLMSMTGEEGREPVKAGSPVADINAGILAALGICAAYAEKLKTGRGQMVDTSLFEAGLHQMFWPMAAYLADGTITPKYGSGNGTSVPYQAFRSSDGWINIGAANQSNWERLLQVIGAPELGEDPRFRTNGDRVRNRQALVPLLNRHLEQRPTAEWVALFDAAGLPAGPILNVAEAANHPQTLARDMIVETRHPTAGTVRGLGLPIRFSGGDNVPGRPPPLLGEHTLEILRELGFDEAGIRELQADGSVLAAPSDRPPAS